MARTFGQLMLDDEMLRCPWAPWVNDVNGTPKLPPPTNHWIGSRENVTLVSCRFSLQPVQFGQHLTMASTLTSTRNYPIVVTCCDMLCKFKSEVIHSFQMFFGDLCFF